jgi:tetratricopeptide (TPR) repeat protein
VAQVQQWWTTARQGQRQLGFIAGEPGMGKTALVAVCVAHMATVADLWVASGQCVDQYGAGEAYLPLLEALGRLGQGPDGSAIVALLRQYAPSWLVHLPALLTPADRDTLVRTTDRVTPTRMLRELADALEVLTAIRPLVLVLEDLHWSDQATLAWLAYVARRPDPARLLILGTYRPVDVLVEAHPLRRMITELRHHGQCADLVLDAISEAAVTAYLAQRFGALPRPTGLAQVLHRHTHGNPLFLLAMVEELLAQQRLKDGDDGWCLHGGWETITGLVPESLRRLIEQQLEQLTPDEQALLDAASVAGSTFTAAAVAAGVAQPEELIDVRCATWARQGRFVCTEGTETWPDGTVTARYRFRHAVYHDVIYGRVAAGQRVRLHRRIGLRTEAGYGAQAPRIATALALHFTRAHDAQRAVHYLRHAADNAMQRAAYPEAMTFGEQALQALASLPEDGDTRVLAIELRLALGGALIQLGEYRRCLTLLGEAEALARALDDRARLGRVLVSMALVLRATGDLDGAMVVGWQVRELAVELSESALQVHASFQLGIVYHAIGDFGRAAALLRKNVEAADWESDTRSTDVRIRSQAWLARTLSVLGVFAEGQCHGEEALRLATRECRGDAPLLAHACLGRLYLAKGNLTQAIRVYDQGLALCRASGNRSWLLPLVAGLGYASALQGRLAEGRALLEEGISECISLGALGHSSGWVTWLSEVYRLAGRSEEAWQHARQALDLARQQKARGDEALALHQLSVVYAHSDPPDAAQAAAHYQQALALAEALGMRPLQAHCHRCLGMLYATTGQQEQARVELSTAIEMYQAMDMTFWLPQTAAALAQMEGQ